MSSATPSDTDRPADSSECPTIDRLREVFEEPKDALNYHLPLVYTPFDTREKDMIGLLVEELVVASPLSNPQTCIWHNLSSIAPLGELLKDSEYHG